MSKKYKTDRRYKRVFNDEEKLKEMLKLRKQGWFYEELAEKYKVHHSSIIDQCQKAELPTFNHKQTEKRRQQLRRSEERINLRKRRRIRIKAELKRKLISRLPKEKLSEYDKITARRINKGQNYETYLKKEPNKLDILVGL